MGTGQQHSHGSLLERQETGDRRKVSYVSGSLPSPLFVRHRLRYSLSSMVSSPCHPILLYFFLKVPLWEGRTLVEFELSVTF